MLNRAESQQIYSYICNFNLASNGSKNFKNETYKHTHTDTHVKGQSDDELQAWPDNDIDKSLTRYWLHVKHTILSIEHRLISLKISKFPFNNCIWNFITNIFLRSTSMSVQLTSNILLKLQITVKFSDFNCVSDIGNLQCRNVKQVYLSFS